MKYWMSAAILGVSFTLSSAASAGELSCPAAVESELTSGGQAQSFEFRYVSFFDGDPSEMADLAPDDGPNPKVLDQRWQFTRTAGRPIYMVCRYHGTEQTVKTQVPEHVKECRLRGLMDGKGEVVGSPTLECE